MTGSLTGGVPGALASRSGGRRMANEYPIGEKIFLAMLQTAEGLGHALPWAVATDAYPGSAQELHDVTDDLEDKGWIKRTTKGFVSFPVCREHDET
jgi:hypothetical protein